MRLPEATVRLVWRVSSALAISSLPVRGKGSADLREKTSCSFTGRSFWSARWMELLPDWTMFLLRRVMEGREGATVTGRVRVRPSLREKLAVRRSPGRSLGAGVLGGRVRWRELPEGAGAGVVAVASVVSGAGLEVRLARVSCWT